MKIIKRIIVLGGIAISQSLYGQTTQNIINNQQPFEKKTCAILNIDEKGSTNYAKHLTSELTAITKRELGKLGRYQLAYSEDIKKILTDKKINTNDCFDMPCLLKAGKATNTDIMLSGYIYYTSENIVISYREIDVKQEKIINSITKEFKRLPDQVKNMIKITLQEMYLIPVDKTIEKLLVEDESQESYINNNGSNRLNLSGTRMGFVTILGESKDILKAPRHEGGFDANPMLFQFGYQFETMYLNNGRMQGLFEFIPTLTGLEQGLFLPSLTVLHGIRDNKTGLEFAFGPTVGLTTKSEGYYDDGQWKLKGDWQDTVSNPNPITKRLDSRGDIEVNPGFVFAVGFSIKSGNLNLPINAFTVMQKNALRVGLSIGINTRGNKK